MERIRRGHLVWYESLLLRDAGILHGFGCREISARECVAAQRCAIVHAPATRQVHSAMMHCVDAPTNGMLEGDALITATPGILLPVRTADCLPLLWWDPRHHVVGAVHAGWRGLAARIISAVFARAATIYGLLLRDLHVAIGPAIGPHCYEVGPEVIRALQAAGHATGSCSELRGHGKWWLDLATCARQECLSNGIVTAQMDCANLCTHCLSEEFHSYRRSPGVSQRQESFIMIRPGDSLGGG